MTKLIQISKVKIQKEPGKSKIKRAQIEGFPDVLRMGIHGGIAQYFKLSPEEPMPSTLDYIVAAVGGCMTGTVAGALEARGVRADPEKLQVEAEGKIVEVNLGDIMAHVVVRIGKSQVESVITRRSAEQLGLKKGDKVTVVVKATRGPGRHTGRRRC